MNNENNNVEQNNVVQNNNMEQPVIVVPNEELKKMESKRKRRKVWSVISRIFWTLLFLVILFETVIGILDMQRLNEDKEPVWYISTKEEVKGGKKETTYNLGLYVIVKEVEGTRTRIVLKPFFLK